MKEVPVLITGGGSVGLSLAAELGWRDIDCLVVEEAEGLNQHPRANAVANRTMEYYRRWGIDQAITDAGVPPDHLADYYWLSSLHGRELHCISLPPFKKIKEVKDTTGYVKEEHTWSPYLKTITGQNEVENAILDYVQSRESIEYRFNWKLMSFAQEDTGVTCELEDQNSGATETIRAQYLLACDGGRSAVREALGIGLSGRSDLARFVSIYFKAPDFMNCHKFGPANIFFPLHVEVAGFILNWDGGTTFTYHLMLKDGLEWDAVDPVAAIEAVLGAATPIEIISTQPWTAHALVADQYGLGRVWMAGDAVHLFTPTGGFGMNTGVSDAIDLAWKVQAMLEGWGGEHLLESYFEERHPIGVRNTTEAADCFDRLNAAMQYGDELDEEGPKGDEFRSRLGVDLKDQEKLISSSGTLLGYRYEGSPIIVSDDTPEPADNPRTYIPIARPGHRAPHIWLEEGVSLLDLLGAGFTLLDFGGEEVDLAPIKDAAKKIGLPLEIVFINDDDAAALYERRLVLVRPDLMVAWRGDVLPDDLPALLDNVRGV
ncbi:MAG: hypothetical protein HON14_01380 [Rhodospirillaceae bacterium]|nr:hypothetical protein [Rhodospirillaceae bacterium]MBT4937754.1 hypothetical protein [Rhodospirillaceae bacterium]MBT5940002.1 hypothetical protein [Rhodospirillaceae bacterium]MBT7268267.1 hypothetical protein [Rhodospirillaceae bacterium]